MYKEGLSFRYGQKVKVTTRPNMVFRKSPFENAHFRRRHMVKVRRQRPSSIMSLCYLLIFSLIGKVNGNIPLLIYRLECFHYQKLI